MLFLFLFDTILDKGMTQKDFQKQVDFKWIRTLKKYVNRITSVIDVTFTKLGITPLLLCLHTFVE